MALTSGTRLGAYEVLALIGAGGMGEVYRARDTKLNRDVALKVLPEAFALDADRLARFQREAQVLASLNHPNIAAVYGLEESSQAIAIVMELVEGPTLADKVKVGPVPIDEALPIARQIADALEAAHEKGVVHRDLKPANVKVTPEGQVKVLDFGLAKAFTADAADPNLTNSPTMSLAATRAGMILGTAAYMSPEQARGKTVDKRTDIWAFGCVLYEMLAGTRAFEGDEITDILAAVVRAEPNWGLLPAETPPAIRRLLRRCLEKDRKERVPDIAVARIEIKEALTTPAEITGSVPATSPKDAATASGRWLWSLAGVAAVFAIAAATFATLYLRTEPVVPPVVRFQVSPVKGSFIVAGNGPRMEISPDGTQLAFVAATNDGTADQLWLRRMDATEISPLPGTEGAVNPFWSPDSRSIAFFTGAQLKRIDLSGGPPRLVTTDPGGVEAAGVSTGTWNRDGTIVFSSTGIRGLHQVPSNGGTPAQVTTLDRSRSETGHYWPRFLPDGRHFLYWVNSTQPGNRGIMLGSLDSKDTRLIVASDFAAGFAPPNHLLFRRGSTLFAQTFNLESFQLEGEAVRVADPVGAATTLARPGFSTSDTGVLVVWPVASATAAGDTELAIYDRTGKKLTSLGTSQYRGFDVSPDGTRVATHLHEASGGGDIWLLDLERGTRPRFTFDALQDNSSPVWSNDGSRIAFASLRAGMWGLYQKPADGTGQEELLFESSTPKSPSAYSPDGKSLLFENVDPKTRNDLWLLPLEGDKKPVAYLRSPFFEGYGQISPNGRWVAYQSNESGQRNEIYVRSLSNLTGKWQVSIAGGTTPRWRHDGKELFFGFNQRVFAVDVEAAGDGLRFGAPKVLFESAYRNPGHDTPSLPYAVSGDGQHFFIPTAPSISASADIPLTITLNWTSALRK